MQRFLFFLALISLLMDGYVYQGVRRLTSDWRPVWRRLVRRVFWVFFAALIVSFGMAIYLRFSQGMITPAVQCFINAFLTFFVTKLVFLLVLFAEDIYRGTVFVYRFFQREGATPTPTEPLLPERRKVVSRLALLLAALPFSAFLYGVTRGKYAYTVHRQAVFFDDLPEAFHGFRIVQISDTHAGSFDDADAVQRGVDLAREQQADMVVFTGDLVNNLASEIEPYVQTFGQLKAPYGQFAVLGNHDYGMYHNWPSDEARDANLHTLKKHHAAMGFRLLLNEHVHIEKDGARLCLLGVENWGKGFIKRGDLPKALAGSAENDFKILLSHDPSHWTEIIRNYPTHVHLTLSGHTHGMQFGVETPLFDWSPVQYRYRHWAGLLEEKKQKLYVNRGFGFIGFSGRVGIWPEITVLELRRG